MKSVFSLKMIEITKQMNANISVTNIIIYKVSWKIFDEKFEPIYILSFMKNLQFYVV